MTDRNTLFHQAWGQAKASPEYDKKVWIELERATFEPKSAKDIPVMTGVRGYLPIFLAQAVVVLEEQTRETDTDLAQLAVYCKKYVAGDTGVLAEMALGAYVQTVMAGIARATEPPQAGEAD